MDDVTKLKIGTTALEILMTKGLPAMVKVINTWNSQEFVTLEDIQAVRGDLDSAGYFKPEDKGIDV